MSQSHIASNTLSLLVQCIKTVPDPDVVSSKEFQDYILGHWEVENCLHLQKDREYEEDKHGVRRGGWGEVWTVRTNMAVLLVNLLHQRERTLRAVRERCNADPASAARILGWKT